MQITLIQSEIEQALKNYINDIMSVKDGMEIEIQLKATRGEEGTTAIIDIVPQKPKVARSNRTSGEIPAKSESVKAAATPVKAEPMKAAVEAEPVAESVAEAEADDAEQVAEQAQEPEALEPAPVEAEQAPAEEAPRKSLFAGLSKPQN